MRLRNPFTALFLGFVLLGAPEANASPENPANVSELIQAVEATYTSATSIRAEFLQVDKSKSLGTEVRQRGKIALERPRKVRVEMGIPVVTQTYVSNGTTMWAYSVKDKQAFESPELGGGGGMGILLEDLGKLDELFDVTMLPETPGKPSVTVKLIPKTPGAFKSLQLTLSKGKYVLQDLVLVNQLDDVTQMTFTAVVMNKDIPDAEFTFVAPPGVKVVKTGAM